MIRLALIALIIVFVVVLAWAVFMTVRNRQLRRIIAGADDPELLLPKAERQERARKKLQRLDDEELDRRYHEMVSERNNPFT
jgi:hypothetical protein